MYDRQSKPAPPQIYVSEQPICPNYILINFNGETYLIIVYFFSVVVLIVLG